MRRTILALALLTAPLAAPSVASAHDHGLRVGVSLGFRLPIFPQLVQVPGTPVYYAPRVAANYFFHEGLFWLFDDGRWYSSAWYDGPWDEVGPEYVPAFVLRVPVGYYRSPPRWFVGWRHDAPPRWDDHWGRGWAHRRHGWDRWDRHAAVRPAPLPWYQRDYAGDRYPRTPERQRAVRVEHGRRGWDDDGHRGGRRGGGDDDGHRGRGRGDRSRGDERGRDDHGRRGDRDRR